MKSYLKLLAVACATAFASIAVPVVAAESAPAVSTDSPAGTWKWTQQGRDGASWEQTLKLDYADGKLTGTLLGTQSPMGQIPDAPISEATFKDGMVAFSIAREFNGRSFVIKYQGKLSGDTITGTSERPNRDGGTVKRDWTATRAK